MMKNMDARKPVLVGLDENLRKRNQDINMHPVKTIDAIKIVVTIWGRQKGTHK